MARVLYLEDESWQIAGTVVTRLEREFGHEVVVVATLPEAIGTLHSDGFEVLVLDVMLDPERAVQYRDSAFEVVTAVKNGAFAGKNAASVPIVIASGVLDAVVQWTNGERIKVQDALSRVGIPRENCVSKPFTAEELNAAILQAIAGGTSSRERTDD